MSGSPSRSPLKAFSSIVSAIDPVVAVGYHFTHRAHERSLVTGLRGPLTASSAFTVAVKATAHRTMAAAVDDYIPSEELSQRTTTARSFTYLPYTIPSPKDLFQENHAAEAPPSQSHTTA
jgi:hypothetical protein